MSCGLAPTLETHGTLSHRSDIAPTGCVIALIGS